MSTATFSPKFFLSLSMVIMIFNVYIVNDS
jgi:hypothetical protein